MPKSSLKFCYSYANFSNVIVSATSVKVVRTTLLFYSQTRTNAFLGCQEIDCVQKTHQRRPRHVKITQRLVQVLFSRRSMLSIIGIVFEKLAMTEALTMLAK